ncbi:hypothetical protein LguiB_032497 [Lonicera macranthoides]
MTRENPMTASERQRKRVKHVATTGVKQYGKRKKLTPPAQDSPIPELPPPQSNVLPTTPAPPPAPPAALAPESESLGQEDDDGGPIDKSVLISFKDHIAYAIWNREEVLFTLLIL